VLCVLSLGLLPDLSATENQWEPVVGIRPRIDWSN
jgi:hypothetical protein